MLDDKNPVDPGVEERQQKAKVLFSEALKETTCGVREMTLRERLERQRDDLMIQLVKLNEQIGLLKERPYYEDILKKFNYI